MDCRTVRDQLMLSFADESLPADVARHVEGCPECTRYLRELQIIGERLGTDDLFYPEVAELKRLVTAVDRQIAELEPAAARPARVTPLRPAFGYLAAAAVVVLVAGVYLVSYLSGINGEGGIAGLGRVDTVFQSADEEAELYEPDESSVGMLLYDFVDGRKLTAGEVLLDDITVDELEYLEENFDVGDLL
ncbi:MAG: hypothetical protein OEW00_00695 [candidate division Zixibacteria bacterium]|nr:hypothetical protein [candidate division Zixibacteria bacterium]